MRRLVSIFLISIVISGTASANRAEITLSRTIDVPDRTVRFENQTFEITEIGSYKTNQEIGFTIDVAAVDNMLVVLYDRDKISTWFRRFNNANGRAASTIPANKTGEPGTYALAVSYENNIIGAIPVIISDYDLSVTTRSNKVIAGRTLDVDVMISKNGIPVDVDNNVKVVLAKGSSSFETNATFVKTGEYEANIEIPLSANGTFSLYSLVATERKVYMNYPEILGVESGGYVEILPPSAEKAPFLSGAAAMILLLNAVLFMRRKL